MAVKTILKKTIFCNQRTSELKALCTSQQPVLSQQFESFTRVQCLWTGVRVERGGGGISPKCPPLVDSLTPFPPSPSSRSLALCSDERGNGNGQKRKTCWNNFAALPRISCLPSPCHFLLQVRSLRTNQASARVPLSFMACYIPYC